jgi:uncharacterized protein YjbJ (UPF0337 family)
MMQLASRKSGPVCSLQNFLPSVFRQSFRGNIKCLVLSENNPPHKSARKLQGKMPREVVSRGGNKQNTKTMSALTAKGNWNIAKGRLKQKIARLMDDEEQFAAGKEDELIGRIQKRTGQAREKIECVLDDGCHCKP